VQPFTSENLQGNTLSFGVADSGAVLDKYFKSTISTRKLEWKKENNISSSSFLNFKIFLSKY
jgi:hypothetical protein